MAQDNPAFTASCSDISLDVRASERLPGSQAPTAPTAPTPRVANGSAQNGETQLVKWPRDAEADDYDPYEHHQVAHPTTNTDTLFHLLKGCFGSGILAMPEAFKFAGYVLGTVGTAIIGVLATLAVHLLINAEYALAKRRRVPTLTYPETGRAAFEDGPARTRWMAKYMKGCIDAFVLANQFGCCISYIIFVASNIQAVVERYTTGDPLSLRWYMAFVTIALVLLSWVRDLKYLAPCSTVAMTITLASFGVILYYVFRTVPSLEDKIPFGSVGNFPLFFGTAMFSMEAMGVMIPLKNEMRTPRAFGGSFGVLNRAMAPIVVLFMCVGLFGYLQYGETVNAAITLNLPQDDILAQCVRLGMAVALFFSHGLMNYVNFDAVWHKWLQPRCEARKLPRRIMITSEYLVRTGIVLLQFMIGVIFPNLGLLISLVGALCLSMIGLTFPAMIHMATFWYSCSSRRSFLWLVTKDSLIALLGVFALVIGTATSIDGIIRDSSGG